MNAMLSDALRTLGVTLLLCTCAGNQHPDSGPPHAARSGTVDEKAVLAAVRDGQAASYQVNYLKIHADWAWLDATPLDKSGNPLAEGGPSLLHRVSGRWKRLDLAKVPEDPKDPLGAEDASPGYIKNIQKTYPGVPAEIFPKPSR